MNRLHLPFSIIQRSTSLSVLHRNPAFIRLAPAVNEVTVTGKGSVCEPKTNSLRRVRFDGGELCQVPGDPNTNSYAQTTSGGYGFLYRICGIYSQKPGIPLLHERGESGTGGVIPPPSTEGIRRKRTAMECTTKLEQSSSQSPPYCKQTKQAFRCKASFTYSHTPLLHQHNLALQCLLQELQSNKISA